MKWNTFIRECCMSGTVGDPAGMHTMSRSSVEYACRFTLSLRKWSQIGTYHAAMRLDLEDCAVTAMRRALCHNWIITHSKGVEPIFMADNCWCWDPRKLSADGALTAHWLLKVQSAILWILCRLKWKSRLSAVTYLADYNLNLKFLFLHNGNILFRNYSYNLYVCLMQ